MKEQTCTNPDCNKTYPLTDEHWYRASYQTESHITYRQPCKKCIKLYMVRKQPKVKKCKKSEPEQATRSKDPTPEEIKEECSKIRAKQLLEMLDERRISSKK